MSASENITYAGRTPTTRPRPEDLRPGDEVEVFDGRLGDYTWLVVLDVVERGDRFKMRLEGCTFYADFSCARDVRHDHFVPPHRAPQAPPVKWEDAQWRWLWNDNFMTDARATRTIH